MTRRWKARLGAFRRRGTPAGMGPVVGLLLLTHYWALFLYAVVGVGLLVSLLRERFRAVWWSLGALAAGVVPFLPWLPTFLYQSRHTGTPWTGRGGAQVLLSVVTEWFPSLTKGTSRPLPNDGCPRPPGSGGRGHGAGRLPAGYRWQEAEPESEKPLVLPAIGTNCQS
ncbi:hypothetical protein B0E53_02353 [Micromonospora sp. MH33]|nr:hypothetical protein B0E53_02353 [Micromonospora sp. MH33]